MVGEEIAALLQNELKKHLHEALYEQWFSDMEVVSSSDTDLELGVKNRFFKSWIETRYLDVVREAAQQCFGKPVTVTISVSPRLYTSFRQAQEKALVEASASVRPVELRAPEQPIETDDSFSGMELNPEFTFDTFIVGASNRLSQAVALRAVESPEEFGRLYFCGEHGVGKTHLLQALCHETFSRRPGARVAYVTCERFVAEFGFASVKGEVTAFREKYRKCDVLVMDQLQVLGKGNKTATQAELVSLIDDMTARGRQVVFAATQLPGELDGVDSRLRDRLAAGFVDRLSLPDESVRRRLIASKLADRGVVLSDEAVALIARETNGNVMILEGAVNRLAALIDVGGMLPSLPCLRMALDMSAPVRNGAALRVEDIIGACAEELGLTPDAVCGRGRSAPARRARTVAVVLCRKLLGTSYAEIGNIFGGRSHATIISMVKKAPADMFTTGLASRPVERILFKLGVSVKPEELLERQGGLFE